MLHTRILRVILRACLLAGRIEELTPLDGTVHVGYISILGHVGCKMVYSPFRGYLLVDGDWWRVEDKVYVYIVC